MSEYTYYEITGGPVMAAIREFEKLRLEHGQAAKDICAEFGATNVWGNSTGLSGLLFNEAPPPAGWVKVKCRNSNVYKPSEKRNPHGKAIMDRMRGIFHVDVRLLQNIVTGKDNPFMFMEQNLRIRFLSLFMAKDLVILGCPVPESEWSDREHAWNIPTEGTRKLKMSEYHALLEANEERVAAIAKAKPAEATA